MIYKVIDNFLNDKTFYNYYKLLMSETTMWAWQNEANSDSKNKDLNEQILFGHMLVGDYQWAYDDANKFVDPIMLEIKKRNPDDKFEVCRAKMNLIIRNDKPVKYGLHFDLEKINGRLRVAENSITAHRAVGITMVTVLTLAISLVGLIR